MVVSHTNLSAKNGKSNLYTSLITSVPSTGALTLVKVLLEKSIMEMEAPDVIKTPIAIAIFTPLSTLNSSDLPSELEMYLNSIQDAINISQNNQCSNS